MGVGLVVIAVCLALMVSQGSASRAVADHARGLHWTNTATGSASVARAGNAQAVVFAVDHRLGVAAEDALDTAVAEAHNTLGALKRSAELIPEDQVADAPRLEDDLDRFIAAADLVLTLVESGEIDRAIEISQGESEQAYDNLYQALTTEQRRLLGLIDATEGQVGRTASIAKVVVTLLIPAAALFTYFLLARRQMRERRIEMEAELQAARQLSRAKDEFIAGVSHELRTPLTSIYGFSEVLLETGLVDRRNSMELIGVINHQSADLSRMVEDLLTAARLEAGALSIEVADVDLAQEVDVVLEPFRRAGTSVAVTCPPIVVRADRLRVRQVIRNLVSNAERHGGTNIRIEARCRGETALLTVIDDGSGVPAEVQDRLFQRFVNDGRQALLAGSVGLGLAVARSLVEAMGGEIRYSRIEGHSVFSVFLTRGEDPSTPDQEVDIDAGAAWELAAVGALE